MKQITNQTPEIKKLAYDAHGNRNFPKKDSDTHCNGKVHRQFRYCQRPAGWGTEHPGKGRCKLHGGCNKKGRQSGELRYSDFVPSVLVEKYEEFSVESDKDIKSLNDEIGLVRAKIAYLEQDSVKIVDNKMLLSFGELLRRLIETKHKVECGVTKHVTVEIVGKLVDEIIKIIDESIDDTELKKGIANRMRRLNDNELGLLALN